MNNTIDSRNTDHADPTPDTDTSDMEVSRRAAIREIDRYFPGVGVAASTGVHAPLSIEAERVLLRRGGPKVVIGPAADALARFAGAEASRSNGGRNEQR